MTLDEFQRRIGVQFTNRDLLQQAVTHRSYANEHEDENLVDNERLEFLGDAVIDFLAGEMLYRRYPEMTEGDLTRLRAALVRTEALARLAQVCHVDAMLRMGRGEEASGGRERPSNLAGAFEALVGAMYLDRGMEAVSAFATPQLATLLERVMAAQSDRDARSQLQEWSQAEYNLTPAYRTVSETGPDHDKEFTVEALIGDKVVGVGLGRSKQAAAQAAAGDALRQVGLTPSQS